MTGIFRNESNDGSDWTKGQDVFDLKIERLRLTIQNAAGHEHRIQPIALRALALLAHQLDGPNTNVLSRRHFDALTARPIDLDLNHMSDEQAAEGIARTWANSLVVRTEEGSDAV